MRTLLKPGKPRCSRSVSSSTSQLIIILNNQYENFIHWDTIYTWYSNKKKEKHIYIYNIRTLSVNIKFICTSFRNRQNSEPLASFSCLFRSEYKWILYLYLYLYLNKQDRNKRHSSPFINVVKGVFFVVCVTLVPVSYLSAPSAIHSYRVPGKFIRLVRIKQNLFV